MRGVRVLLVFLASPLAVPGFPGVPNFPGVGVPPGFEVGAHDVQEAPQEVTLQIIMAQMQGMHLSIQLQNLVM